MNWLDHWQTLVGALVGGLLGVIGALIVGAMAVRRQRWVMASALLPDTHELIAANDAFERALEAIDPRLRNGPGRSGMLSVCDICAPWDQRFVTVRPSRRSPMSTRD